MTEIGIITEQGDLGLGFDFLNNKDQHAYDEATNRNNSSNTEVINEDKKN